MRKRNSSMCINGTSGASRDRSAGASTVGPIVVKVGGAALDSTSETAAIAATIASLHHHWPSGVVVVHGGGVEIDRHLSKLGLVSEKRDGIRLTPSDHIEEVVAVLAGKMNKRLVGQLQNQGVAAVGLCLGDGFLLRTIKASHYPFDPGHVGRAVGGDPRLVQALLPAGFLPVLCSIGLDAQGLPLNVNADDAASDLAKLLGASNLLLLTDVTGVLDADGSLLPQLTAEDAEQRIAAGEITGGMVPKVRSAIATAGSANIPVTIASWRDASQFQKLSKGSWFGTRIVPEPSVFVSSTGRAAVAKPDFAPSVAVSAGSL